MQSSRQRSLIEGQFLSPSVWTDGIEVAHQHSQPREFACFIKGYDLHLAYQVSCIDAYIIQNLRSRVQVRQEISIRVSCKGAQQVCKVFAQLNDSRAVMWYPQERDSFDAVKENVVFSIVGNDKSLAISSVGVQPWRSS